MTGSVRDKDRIRAAAGLRRPAGTPRRPGSVRRRPAPTTGWSWYLPSRRAAAPPTV